MAIQVSEISYTRWTCPKCNTENETLSEKFIGDELECDGCEEVFDDWEMV